MSWPTVTLGDLCTFRGGQAFAKELQGHTTGEIPFIKVSDLDLPRNGFHIQSARNWVSRSLAGEHRFRPHPEGSVVFAKIGEAIKRERVRTLTRPTIIDNNMMSAAPKPHVDPDFLRYLFEYTPFSGNHGGTSLPYLRATDLSQIVVAVPDLPEQQRIAGVLGAFDDLIETNRGTVEALEAMATALAGLALEEVALRDIAHLGNTKQVKPTGDVDHFSIPAFDANQRPVEDHGSQIKSGKLSVSTPTVLVSRLNPVSPRAWMAYPDEAPAVASTEFVPLLGNHEVSAEQVWAITNRGNFWDQMRSTATGSTNSRQRVDRAAIPEIIVPDPRTLTRAQANAITTCVRASEELRRESHALAAQRDELLPLLMSGKVLVSEVEGNLP